MINNLKVPDTQRGVKEVECKDKLSSIIYLCRVDCLNCPPVSGSVSVLSHLARESVRRLNNERDMTRASNKLLFLS